MEASSDEKIDVEILLRSARRTRIAGVLVERRLDVEHALPHAARETVDQSTAN